MCSITIIIPVIKIPTNNIIPLPALIKALINPVEEVPKTITLLSATTFVSEVDSPTLSLMVPLLARGLNEKLTATKRKVAVYAYFFFVLFEYLADF